MTDTFSEELLEFMKETIVADNYRDLASRILKATAVKLCADIGTLWRAVEDDGNKHLILAASFNVEFLPEEKEITYDILPADTPNSQIKGLTAWIAIKNKPVFVKSHEQLKDPNMAWAGSHQGKWDQKQFWKEKEKEKEIPFGCLIGYPITLGDNLLGVIKFERYSRSIPFSASDSERVKKWSTLIALTLKGMISREEQEKNRQKSLRELSSKLLVPTSRTYYDDIIELTAKIMNADICTLWLNDERKNKLYLASQYGLNPSTIHVAKDYDIPTKTTVSDEEIDGLTAWTFVRKRPFYAHNWEKLSDHPSHRGHWDQALWNSKPHEEFGCLYSVPLIIEDKAIGIIKIEKRRNPGFVPFTEVELATFEHIAVLVSVAPPLNAVVKDKDALVLDYFHILRAPTSNAIFALSSLREEFKRGEKARPERIESRIKMISDNLSVAYSQTLNAFELATQPLVPEKETWRNLHEILKPSLDMFHLLFPEVVVKETDEIKNYDLLLTNLQLKKLNVVFHNLIDNAIAFSQKKPVEISAKVDKDYLVLLVIDHGVGIPKDKLEHVWEPGYTLRSDALTRPESRGQGLAIVSRTLEEFRWGRKIRSKVNRGTEIEIHITQKYWRINK